MRPIRVQVFSHPTSQTKEHQPGHSKSDEQDNSKGQPKKAPATDTTPASQTKQDQPEHGKSDEQDNSKEKTKSQPKMVIYKRLPKYPPAPSTPDATPNDSNLPLNSDPPKIIYKPLPKYPPGHPKPDTSE